MRSENTVGKYARRTSFALAAAIGFLLICTPLFSQTTEGTIQGSVVDQSGGAVAGAKVTVVDPARGTSRPLVTDSAGQYQAGNLTPGIYTVRVEANGFQTVQHENVNVAVGQTSRVDVTLLPGAQSQTVTVTSEALAVNTTDATLGGTVNSQQLTALPLNGRNYQRLLLLRPGVVGAIGGGTGSESSNGLKSGENMTLLEGVTAIAQSTGGSVLNTSYHQGDSTSLLPLDAIQEFNEEQNPKAEYGWREGSVTNIGIRSGTNDLHGTAYAFGRDTALDAANPFFAPVNQVTGLARTPVPISLEQYGATGGYHIIKDKLFFFLGYEDLNYTVGNGSTPTVPTDIANGTGTVGTDMIATCNSIAKITGGYNPSAINPLSAQLAGITISPTTGCSVSQAVMSPLNAGGVENLFPYNPTTSAAIIAPLVTTNPIHNGVAKLDYVINEKNHLSGSFFIGYANANIQNNPGQVSPLWENHSLTRVETGTGAWVWTPNSSWVNEFRAGLALLHFLAETDDQSYVPANPWPNGYSFNTGVNVAANPLFGGLPEIQITGFSGFLGQGQRNGLRGPEGDADYVDNVSYLRGKHAFKFGFEFLDSIADNDQINYANGDIVFKSLANYLTGTVNNGVLLVGDPITDSRGYSMAGFIQDDWRVKPRLTLNLGLRYELNLPPFEKHNYLGNFYANGISVDGTVSGIGQAGGPFPAMYNTDKKDFAPRFGLAWDVQGNGKTVVRAGAGILYNMEEIGQLIQLNPFGQNIPSIGINNSGLAINQFSPEQLPLQGSQITWGASVECPTSCTGGGVVFPPQSVTTTGTYAGTYNGVSCTYPGEVGLPSGYIPVQCAVAGATAPNFHTPWSGQWTLDIQRAITSSLTVEAAYVGNHGSEASRFDINQPPVGWGWNLGGASASPVVTCLASASANYNNCQTTAIKSQVTTNEIAGRPFNAQYPYLSNIDQTGNQYYSNYNALQVTVTQRLDHGLTFLAGYTLSHALDTFSSGTFQGSVAAPPDVRQVGLLYANADTDSRNRFTLSATYAFPGKKVWGQMLEGWTVSPIVALYSGVPWGAEDTTNDFLGTGEVTQLADNAYQWWNYSGPNSAFTATSHGIPCYGAASGCTAYSKLPGGTPPAVCMTAAQAPYAGNAQLQQLALAALWNNECYVQNGGVLTPPAYGTIGNEGRNNFRGPAYYNLDLNVGKDWKFKERYGVQFRIDFFNLLNRADFAQTPGSINPAGGSTAGSGFGCTCTTPDETGFTNAVLGSGAPRSVQLGLKLTY